MRMPSTMRAPGPAMVLFVVLLALVPNLVQAEAFKVLRFHSEIQLNRDGTMDITEDILLEFSESKHGFIRKIPFRYEPAPFVQGEIAKGHANGVAYHTPITGIDVEGWEFTVDREASAYAIKIGSGDKYVSGRQRYRIHYRVYGAINFFSKHQELYWNVNGNDWDVEFDSIDAEVILPDNKVLGMVDLQGFMGKYGETGGAVAIQPEAGRVRYFGTRRLAPKEGMTITARFKGSYLQYTPIPLSAKASNFVIDSLRSDWKLNEDGSIDVEERILLQVYRTKAEYVRRVTTEYLGPGIPSDDKVMLKLEPLGMSVRRAGMVTKLHGYYSNLNMGEGTFTIPSSALEETGAYVVELRYRVWGAARPVGKGTMVYVTGMQPDPDLPIAYAHNRLSWPMAIAPNSAQLLASSYSPKEGTFEIDGNELRMEVARPFNDEERLTYCMNLGDQPIAYRPVPKHVDSPDSYYEDYHVDIEVQENGLVRIAHKFKAYQSQWYTPLKRPILDRYNAWNELPFKPGMPNLWGSRGEYLLRNLNHTGELEEGYSAYDVELRVPIDALSKEAGVDSFSYSYEIYGILREDDGTKYLDWPIVELLDHPVDRLTFSLRYPGSAVLDESKAKVFIGPYGALPGSVDWKFAAGSLEGEVLGGMYEGGEAYVQVALPPGAVGNSFSLGITLMWRNHKAVFLPLIFLIPLFFVWLFIGRDKAVTTVVQFYPPDDLTPAEAGLLIDDKLHNRDLLALVYYWGAKGYLSIEEVYDDDGKPKDYRLTRLKKLSNNARKYEKTMFDGLFGSHTTTTVNSQNQKMYSHMATARQELTDWVKKKNFYIPGTEGWATAIRLIGWVVGIVGVVALGMYVFQASSWLRGRWEVPLAWAASSAICFLFAKIMPRKAAFGREQYKKLVGFREFVLRADKAKLEELVNTNPDYFGMTLPYAIALGIATKWVEHFEGWLEAPPSYYHVSDTVRRDFYAQRQFELLMRRQLDRMASNFNSTPPAPSGGGGGGYSSSSSSSSYSSSRSYSSSGSSGGSSYSSGGGYSGGGYGGGGGSSW